MKPFLLLVEDGKFIPAISNYFQYLKYSVKIVSKSKDLSSETKLPDMIIFQVDAKTHPILAVVKEMRARLANEVHVLYLAASRNLKLEEALKVNKIMVMTETENLDRLYKTVERFRMK